MSKRYLVQRVSDGLVLVEESFDDWELSENPDGTGGPDHSLLRFVPLSEIDSEWATMEKPLMAECKIEELTKPQYCRPIEPAYKPGELRMLAVRTVVRFVEA